MKGIDSKFVRNAFAMTSAGTNLRAGRGKGGVMTKGG